MRWERKEEIESTSDFMVLDASLMLTSSLRYSAKDLSRIHSVTVGIEVRVRKNPVLYKYRPRKERIIWLN